MVGNPVLLDKNFKSSSTFKVADVMCVEQAARNFLADPADKTQGSFSYFPAGINFILRFYSSCLYTYSFTLPFFLSTTFSGYLKSLLINKVLGGAAEQRKQIQDLVVISRKYKVNYFVAVRDFQLFSKDVLSLQLSLLSSPSPK